MPSLRMHHLSLSASKLETEKGQKLIDIYLVHQLWTVLISLSLFLSPVDFPLSEHDQMLLHLMLIEMKIVF